MRANETSDVGKARRRSRRPRTDGHAPGSVSISDTAHLTGLTADATGKVTFNVYGPFPANSSPTCSGASDHIEVTLGTVGADHAIDVASGPSRSPRPGSTTGSPPTTVTPTTML